MSTAGTARRFARSSVRIFFYLAIGTWGACYRLWQFVRPAVRSSARPVTAVLLIRLDLLGDVLFSLPAAEGLRQSHPGARITMLTLPYTAPLARACAAIDGVVSVDTNRIRSVRGVLSFTTWKSYFDVLQRLRAEKFDLCISLNGRMASLWAFLSGSRRTVGYRGEGYPFLLMEEVPGGRYHARAHEVEYVRRLAVHAGAANPPRELHMRVNPEAARSVGAMLKALGVDAGLPLIVVHAGSVHGSAKRWPAGHWAKFIDQLEHQFEVSVILAGAESDVPVSEEVAAACAHAPMSLVGRTSVEELTALLARADLVASSDSGPLHLAVALQRPVLGVYGPTDPLIYGPYNPSANTRIHRYDLPCSPCYPRSERTDCPLGDPICMRLVTVEQMVRSAIQLLSETASYPAAKTSF